NLDAEERFDGGLDVSLGRGGRDFEDVLVALLLDARGLFGHAGGTQDAEDLDLVHASHSSTFLTASAVMITLRAPTRATGSSPCTSRTSTYGRLRAARYSASVASSVTISGWSKPISPSLATRVLVFGSSISNFSTIFRRSWRMSSEMMAQMAARYILRFTFWAKLRGLAAKVTPPPMKIGA